MDAAGGDGLGNDGVAADLGPGEDDLGGGGVELLSDLLDDVVLDEQGQAEAVVAEGGVGGDVDALLLGVLDEGVVLLEEGVALDLVDGGDDAGGVDNGLEVFDGEVGDADGLDLGLGQGDQGLPGVDEGDALVEVDLGVVAGGLGEELAAVLLESNGPVDEVELKGSVSECFGRWRDSVYSRQGSRGRAPGGSRQEQPQRSPGGGCCGAVSKHVLLVQ